MSMFDVESQPCDLPPLTDHGVGIGITFPVKPGRRITKKRMTRIQQQAEDMSAYIAKWNDLGNPEVDSLNW